MRDLEEAIDITIDAAIRRHATCEDVEPELRQLVEEP